MCHFALTESTKDCEICKNDMSAHYIVETKKKLAYAACVIILIMLKVFINGEM